MRRKAMVKETQEVGSGGRSDLRCRLVAHFSHPRETEKRAVERGRQSGSVAWREGAQEKDRRRRTATG